MVALTMAATTAQAAITLTVVANAGSGLYTAADGSSLTTGFMRYGTLDLAAFNALADNTDYAAVDALFTELGTVNATPTGDFISIGNSFDIANISGINAGDQLYSWVFNSTSASTATEYGIFSSTIPTWDVAPDLGTTTLSSATMNNTLVGTGFALASVGGVVPEPSTYALFAGALALAFVAIRRRK